MQSVKYIFEALDRGLNAAVDEKKSPNFPIPTFSGSNYSGLRCVWVENVPKRTEIAIFAEVEEETHVFTEVGIIREMNGEKKKTITIEAKYNETLRPAMLVGMVARICEVLEMDTEHFFNLMWGLPTDDHVARHFLNFHPDKNGPA